MTLRVIREPSIGGATLGSLYVNGVWQCWLLEDQLREISGQPVESWKVKSETAIPAGRYKVAITPSQRFQRRLPLLLDVPGFTGVRIHPGNTVADTEGCLLVGQDRQNGRVLRSRIAFEALFAELEDADGDIWINVEQPQIEQAA